MFSDETARCRDAQRPWAEHPLAERLKPVAAFRRLLAARTDELTAAVRADVMRPPGEVVTTDILPAAAAAKYLCGNAKRVLAPRRAGGRPAWLFGCRDVVFRRPHGVVGLVGTWNYPVFLTAVPLLHALAAGNGVLFKPSEHAPRTGATLAEFAAAAGFPPGLLQLLPADRDAGPRLTASDLDFLHFTGSDAVGRELAAALGKRLIPSALELSGCDAVFALADADPVLAARSAWYAATINSGQTCMAARRLFVHRGLYSRVAEVLKSLAAETPAAKLVTPGQAKQADRLLAEAAAAGCEVLPPGLILNVTAKLAVCREASFAPLLAVIPFDDIDDAVKLHAECPLRLTASVFTADTAAAHALAPRLGTGVVIINDVLVPTAHPGTPFGGRGTSGWGVTQGDEGLLGMTVPQTVTVRSGTFRPHVDTALAGNPAAGEAARGMLRLAHGVGCRERLGGLRQLVRGLRDSGRRHRTATNP